MVVLLARWWVNRPFPPDAEAGGLGTCFLFWIWGLTVHKLIQDSFLDGNLRWKRWKKTWTAIHVGPGSHWQGLQHTIWHYKSNHDLNPNLTLTSNVLTIKQSFEVLRNRWNIHTLLVDHWPPTTQYLESTGTQTVGPDRTSKGTQCVQFL